MTITIFTVETTAYANIKDALIGANEIGYCAPEGVLFHETGLIPDGLSVYECTDHEDDPMGVDWDDPNVAFVSLDEIDGHAKSDHELVLEMLVNIKNSDIRNVLFYLLTEVRKLQK